MLLVSNSADSAVLGRFRDDESTRDLTEFAAELVLLGLGAEVERSTADAQHGPGAGGTSEVAVLDLAGVWQGWYMHHPTGTVVEVDEPTILRLAALGAAGVITGAVKNQEPPQG